MRYFTSFPVCLRYLSSLTTMHSSLFFFLGGELVYFANAAGQLCSCFGRTAFICPASLHWGESYTVLYLGSDWTVSTLLVLILSQVNWDSEKDCFDSFARETSDFFAMKKDWIKVDETPTTQVLRFLVMNRHLHIHEIALNEHTCSFIFNLWGIPLNSCK